MTTNIVIVGAGGIGTRHFQSIAFELKSCAVLVVDKDPSAINRAKELVAELKNDSIKVAFSSNLELVPEYVDVAIIATSSSARMDVIRRLFTKTRVRHLLLEKVLFQTRHEYQEAGSLIDSAGTDTRVNCPRRYYPYFNEIRNTIKQSAVPVIYTVDGSGWGMACNSIHFIDHVEYLTAETVSDFEITSLDPGCATSKRVGFIEVFGALKFIFSSGSVLNLICSKSNESRFKIRIAFKRHVHEIDEFSGVRLLDGQIIARDCRPILQSQLTSRVVNDLLVNRNCRLVDYQTSARQHQFLLDAMMVHLSRTSDLNLEHGRVPIT